MAQDPALLPGIRVLSVPAPLSGNPYQTLLYDALSRHRVVLESAAGFGRDPAPPPSPPERSLVHVHWVWLNKDPLRNYLRYHAFFRSIDRARRLGFRILWTVHNVEPHDDRRLEHHLYRRLASSVDGLIAHSEAAKARLAACYAPRGPIEVIPHGHYRSIYGPKEPRAGSRRTLELPTAGPLFLFFGQLRRYKGVHRLVRAFRGAGVDARLLVAGLPESPALERELRQEAAGDPRIRFDFRHVPDALVPTYFGAADRVVLPFERVTTSGSAILALGFDCPLVLPRRPELVELAGRDAAVYFDDESDLAPALRRSLLVPSVTAEAAARAIADRLDWEPIAAKTRAFFDRILDRGDG